MPDPALVLCGLHRVFPVRGKPDRVALDSVDLTLAAGGVHGLLGPNGAGKTTLCRIVATVLLPTSGSATVLGHDCVQEASAVRRLLGIVFGGERGLYGRLTAAENLSFWCAMYGVPRRRTRARVGELLGRLGLADRADARVETFSRGMKQRLHLARGLVADPPLLVLDEPTVGMDPVSAHEFRALVAELRGEGRTVLLTTHDMAEAESLCDTLTFVDGGRVVGSGTPAEARSWLAGSSRVQVHDLDATAADALARELTRVTGVVPSVTGSTPVTLSLTAPAEQVTAVLATVVAAGHNAVTTRPPSLEEVYLDLLGRDATGARRGMDVG